MDCILNKPIQVTKNKMNNWSQENYPMHHGMAMNIMPNGSFLPLPPSMYTMSDVNPPPSVPMQLLNQAPLPNIKKEDSQTENVIIETDVNDVSSRYKEKRRRSRERSNSQRRDRDRDRSGFKPQDREFNKHDRNDRQDKNKNRHPRERHTKWDNSEKELSPLGGINIQGNMTMHQGMGSYQNIMTNNMIASNMMHNMSNMIIQQPMEQNKMASAMAQMSTMNNMIDQNMIMNQQLMSTMVNQLVYVSAGVIIPPVLGTQMPAHREKPKGCRTVYVGGLPKGVTVDSINEIFQRFGLIDDIKSRNGAFYVRFQRPQCLEQSFVLSGYRFKLHDQLENEATTIFVDYALNRDDQSEYEKQQRLREPTPPRVEPFSTAAFTNLAEKIKIEDQFFNFAPTLAAWLERGECTKKNANMFYSLIQVSNNQSRRLFNEKMQLDEEFQSLRATFHEKYAHVLLQLEQVAKILSVAKHQRVSDHFTKQQRRNIDMWLKMTEEVENIKEEFQALFDEDETEKTGKNVVSLEKYEQLKMDNENLSYELEGYKNEAHLAKDEAERKFEKFKAHFIAQQALQNNSQVYPPLSNHSTPKPQPALCESECRMTSALVPPSEAKLISILTAFLMVHPLGASVDYLTSYVKSLTPNVSQVEVQTILGKYEDVFQCKVTGVGASIDHRWTFAIFDMVKESH